MREAAQLTKLCVRLSPRMSKQRRVGQKTKVLRQAQYFAFKDGPMEVDRIEVQR